SMEGASDQLLVSGFYNTVNISGTDGTSRLYGYGHTVSVSSSNTTQTLYAYNDTIGVSGNGLTLNFITDPNPGNPSGSNHLTVTGSGDTISLVGPQNTVDVSGNNDNIALNSGTNTVNLNGASAAIRLGSPDAGLDHVSGFTSGDIFQFDHTKYGAGLASGGVDIGVLDASHFVANDTGATNADQVFWFNTANDVLYYDADGSGSGQALAVVAMDSGHVLEYSDLSVV
ncbi:hypothetical protein DPM33_35350, partial [Mesorhizobium hawassense]